MEKGKGQNAEVLSQEEILQYLELVDRRLYIVMHSGIDWKPEYAQEMEDIDREIAVLRQKIDAAHAARQDAICHAGVEGASAESLPCADADLGDYDSCAGCPYLEVLGGDCLAPADVYGREDLPCGSDDPDRQKLQDEVKEAYLHGGRTGCMFDDDGNEYYTTIDGVRHYTRLEG